MKNLKILGKVLDKKEQMSINGGEDKCGRTFCMVGCNNGFMRCANHCGEFYLPC